MKPYKWLRLCALFAITWLFSTVAHAQLRLIILDSTIAETVLALGAQDQVVAVTTAADYLEPFADTPKLGGFKQSSSETLLALAPTHILQTAERMHAQTRIQISALGVYILDLPPSPTLEGAHERIRILGQLLQQEQQAQILVQQLDHEMKQLELEVATEPLPVKGVFILAGGGRPTVAGGQGTQAAALLELAGIKNIADSIEGYKILSQEALLAGAPDFIFTNQEGLQNETKGVAAVLAAPGASLTPAYINQAVFSIPGRYLQGLGLSTPAGVRYLRDQVKRLISEGRP